MPLLRAVRCSLFLLQENCSVMLYYLGMQFFKSKSWPRLGVGLASHSLLGGRGRVFLSSLNTEFYMSKQHLTVRVKGWMKPRGSHNWTGWVFLKRDPFTVTEPQVVISAGGHLFTVPWELCAPPKPSAVPALWRSFPVTPPHLEHPFLLRFAHCPGDPLDTPLGPVLFGVLGDGFCSYERVPFLPHLSIICHIEFLAQDWDLGACASDNWQRDVEITDYFVYSAESPSDEIITF